MIISDLLKAGYAKIMLDEKACYLSPNRMEIIFLSETEPDFKNDLIRIEETLYKEQEILITKIEQAVEDAK